MLKDRTLAEWLDEMPLVAVLRGIQPEEALETGKALFDAGFRIMEVTLNSPNALASIRILADALGDRALIGAGTVTEPEAVTDVAAAGGRLVVMPHSDPRVIHEAAETGCAVLPGVATPTEAFAALEAGADGLKLFPAEMLPPAVVKAWRAVLPSETCLVPTGGIVPERIAAYAGAGANGFGTGSALYKRGKTLKEITAAAQSFVAAAHAARKVTA